MVILGWAFIVSTLSACAQKKPTTVIGFYNVENLFDTKDDPNKDDNEFTPDGINNYIEEVYRNKLHNLATVIKGIGTDVTPTGAAIIGMAEVENIEVLNDLILQPEIKQRNYKPILFEGNDVRGIDVALLYQPAYFKPEQSTAIPVSLYGSGKETTRDILYVYGKLSGEAVHILVNHWPSRRGGEKATAGKRATVAIANRRVIDSILKKDKAARIIMMGDLNDNPTDLSLTEVLGTEDIKENVAVNELYNPWTAIYKSGKGTAGYNNRWDLFDQVIISAEWLKQQKGKWTFKQAEIYNPDHIKQSTGRYKGYPHRSFSKNRWINGYSDHFPVFITLEKN